MDEIADRLIDAGPVEKPAKQSARRAIIFCDALIAVIEIIGNNTADYFSYPSAREVIFILSCGRRTLPDLDEPILIVINIHPAAVIRQVAVLGAVSTA